MPIFETIDVPRDVVSAAIFTLVNFLCPPEATASQVEIHRRGRFPETHVWKADVFLSTDAGRVWTRQGEEADSRDAALCNLADRLLEECSLRIWRMREEADGIEKTIGAVRASLQSTKAEG